MPRVVISFLDGEVLHADTPELTFEHPLLEAEVRSIDANCERALLPLSAIRQLIVGELQPSPPAGVVETWDRAVFHFLDGQVLRAWIAPEVALGRHGGVWSMVHPGTDEMRTYGIPYTSLKGVFRVNQWDSRPASERAARLAGIPPHLEQVVRALAEREAQSPQASRREEAALLSRMRSAARSDGE